MVYNGGRQLILMWVQVMMSQPQWVGVNFIIIRNARQWHSMLIIIIVQGAIKRKWPKTCLLCFFNTRGLYSCPTSARRYVNLWFFFVIENRVLCSHCH